MKLTILVPAYNERNTILEIIQKIISVKLNNVEKEIIVLDGCSTDGTREILKDFKHPQVRIVFEARRRGKGAAVKQGFKEASGDYVIVQDADLELDPNEYPKLLNPILKGDAQAVYGSRLLSGNNKMPFHTLFANRFLTAFINLLYGSNLTDIETGFKLLPVRTAKRLDLKCDGFDLDPEITAQILKLGLKVAEVPVLYVPRDKNAGKKIHWTDGFKAVSVIIKYKFSKVILGD